MPCTAQSANYVAARATACNTLVRGSFAQVTTGQVSAGNSPHSPLHYMLGTLAISTKPVPGDKHAIPPGVPAASRTTPLLPAGLPRVALTAGSGEGGPAQHLVMGDASVAEATPKGAVVPPSLGTQATDFYCKQLVDAGLDTRACAGKHQLVYAGHMSWDMAFAPHQHNSLRMSQVAMPVHASFGDQRDDWVLTDCGLAYVRGDMRRGPNHLFIHGQPALDATVLTGDGLGSFPNAVIATGGNCGYTRSHTAAGFNLLPYNADAPVGVAVAGHQLQPGLMLPVLQAGFDGITVTSITSGGHCSPSGWTPGTAPASGGDAAAADSESG